MGNWSYIYDALGQLVQQTDAKLQVANMTYDVLGRLIQKSEPSLTSNWYYDKTKGNTSCGTSVGKLCEITSNNGYDRLYDYDIVGRVDASLTKSHARWFVMWNDYSADGRLLSMTYPSGLVVQNVYTPLGYLKQVVDGTTPSTVYWTADAMDNEGHLTQQTTRNQITTINRFDPLTGRLTSTKAGTTGGATYNAQNVQYTYDSLGNLGFVDDALSHMSNWYSYDGLNRLKSERQYFLGTASNYVNATISGQLIKQQEITWNYDEIGNITNRSDVGAYGYTGTKPHAVSFVTGGSGGGVNGALLVNYRYDANGNLTAASASNGITSTRTVAWTSFNKVQSITLVKGGTTNVMAYLYDPSGDRVQETFTQNGVLQRTTSYFNPGSGAGLLYEEEVTPTGAKQKHYLNAGGYTFGVATYDTSTAKWSTQYWHKDNLGSTVAVTDAMGLVSERMSYEPFGKRRNNDETTDLLGMLQVSTTRRGFTGHEMIDEVGLVNMNGRIYDPTLSRFLSPDPYIIAHHDMQSYNRYSYVNNRPLSQIDPSGFITCPVACNQTVSNAAGSPSPLAGVTIGLVTGGVTLSDRIYEWTCVSSNSYYCARVTSCSGTYGQGRCSIMTTFPNLAGYLSYWGSSMSYTNSEPPPPSEATKIVEKGQAALVSFASTPIYGNISLQSLVGDVSTFWDWVNEPNATCKRYGCNIGVAPLPLFGGGVAQEAVLVESLSVNAAKGAAAAERSVIGRVKDLQNLPAGEKSLLDRLPNMGSPKANWAQNSGVLRQEMGRGLPIRDASPLDTTGQFLNAERNLLMDRDWTFDRGSNLWMPPTP
jgi:RHS repeat-associated protein